VVNANDHHTCSFWLIAGSRVIFCACSLYLFLILIMTLTKEQKSVLAIITGLIVAGWLSQKYWFFIITGVFAISFPFPFLNKPIHACWIFISKIFNWISSHVIFTVLFFIFLTPISLIRKLFFKGPLKIHPDNTVSTFFDRNHLYSENDFINPW